MDLRFTLVGEEYEAGTVVKGFSDIARSSGVQMRRDFVGGGVVEKVGRVFRSARKAVCTNPCYCGAVGVRDSPFLGAACFF